MSVKELIYGQMAYGDKKDAYNPYLRAEQKWDKRDGSVRQENHYLRILLVTSLVANMVLTGGLVVQGLKSTVEPYVVEVGENGYARAVGMPGTTVYNPKEAEVKYFLERFIQDIRTIPLDPVVARRNWINSFAILSSSASTRMNQEFAKENMQKRVGVETTQVTVRSIVQQSQDTYQAQWTEELFGLDGQSKGKYNMIGSFTIEIIPPKTEEEVRLKPLGITIKYFSWTREI